jgi:hypothetical protein
MILGNGSHYLENLYFGNETQADFGNTGLQGKLVTAGSESLIIWSLVIDFY